MILILILFLYQKQILKVNLEETTVAFKPRLIRHRIPTLILLLPRFHILQGQLLW